MTPTPENDPLAVSLLAAQFVGRECTTWAQAVMLARNRLKETRWLIALGRMPTAEDWLTRDHFVLTHKQFIRELTLELLGPRMRWFRRCEIVKRLWPKLQTAIKDLPEFGDESSYWSAAQLKEVKAVFSDIYRQARAQANRRNRSPAGKRPQRAEQTEIIIYPEKNP
jgi:hypothetical protein